MRGLKVINLPSNKKLTLAMKYRNPLNITTKRDIEGIPPAMKTCSDRSPPLQTEIANLREGSSR